MSGPVLSAVCGLLLLGGCVIHTDTSIPDGTYRNAANDTALIVDGELVEFHIPPTDSGTNPHRLGRAYPYQLSKDGSLHFMGSSNDSYYLRLILDCRWRWDGSSFQCRRDDGTTTVFARSTDKVPLPAASKQQAVWLAAAQHVLANESRSVNERGVLLIRSRTSFPGSKAALAQLRKQAAQGFCGLPATDAKLVLDALRWDRASSVRDVLENRPGFSLVDARPEKGDYLGLSSVAFDRQAITGYLNIDISGLAGSIVKMEWTDGAWVWSAECATWTNY